MDKLTSTSIDYINSIENRLKIEVENNEPIFVHDRVSKKNISKLNDEIYDIFTNDLNGMLHQTHKDGKEIIQGIGFGLVNNFEKFIKVGMLYSNRVILWDYLWGRILCDIENYQKNLDDIGFVANNLVRIKESVEKGGIVILPHPTFWKKNTITIINELREKKEHYNTTNFGLACTLSVALDLNIQPYTLYDENTPSIEGSKVFNFLMNSEKNEYLFNITKLLDEKPFELIDEISVNKFYNFLNENPKFFYEFRDTFLIPNEGKSEAERNQIFLSRKKLVIEEFEKRNSSKNKTTFGAQAERITLLAALANIVYGASITNPEIPLLIALTSLSASLGKHIYETIKKKDSSTMILGFEKLDEITIFT
jgi:hypothetical protein